DVRGIARTVKANGGSGNIPKIIEFIGDDEVEKQTNIFEFIEEEKTKDVEAKPFKYASLFSGIGGFESALNPLGGECVFASEFDKFAQQSYTALYGNEHLHGDITEIDAKHVPDHDVLVGGFPCFVEGTLINTSEGLKPIEEVRKGDYVLTHNNRLKEVVVPMVKEADSVLTVKITGSIQTKVTSEHPYYVVEGEDVWA